MAIAVEITDGYAQGIGSSGVGGSRSEGAIAVVEQNRNGTVSRVRSCDIWMAIAIEISDDDGLRPFTNTSTGGVNGRATKTASAVIEQHSDLRGRVICGDDIRMTIAVEIASRDGPRRTAV